MIKFLKRFFLPILCIVIVGAFSYVQRNSLCDSYNREVSLHIARYINKEDREGKRAAIFFAEQSKKQFANKLDNLILIIFCGFGTVIISQLGINKKKQLESFTNDD